MKRALLIGLLITAGASIGFAAGCAVDEPVPPDYRSPLPTHPYTVRTYDYYPDAQVYFDPARNLYFWPDSGVWVEGRRLPQRYRNLGESVQFTTDTDEPYRAHHLVVQDHPRPIVSHPDQ